MLNRIAAFATITLTPLFPIFARMIYFFFFLSYTREREKEIAFHWFSFLILLRMSKSWRHLSFRLLSNRTAQLILATTFYAGTERIHRSLHTLYNNNKIFLNTNIYIFFLYIYILLTHSSFFIYFFSPERSRRKNVSSPVYSTHLTFNNITDFLNESLIIYDTRWRRVFHDRCDDRFLLANIIKITKI